MNPFQKIEHDRVPKPYNKALSSIAYVMALLYEDLEQFKSRENHNKYAAIKQENFITAVENFIKASQNEIDQQVEIIRKQALIIESAGIVYPTINQSLGHIQQIYQATKGLDVNDDPINLTIKII